MRRGENANPVPSELYSAAQDGILVSTDGVKDYNELKTLSEINQELREEDSHLEETKADKADTLEGYGITDAYTKDEVDLLLQEAISDLDLARVATTGDYNDLENTPDLTLKVDKVEGKGLSTNDFTDEDKLAIDSLKQDSKYQLLDLLFSDGTVSNIYNADPNKTPIAVCFGTSDLFADGLARFAACYNGMSRWGDTGNIYGIPKYTTKLEALQDFDGKDHTEELVKAEYSTVYRQLPAADFCMTYNPEGYGLGEWYVPAVGELNIAFRNHDIMFILYTGEHSGEEPRTKYNDMYDEIRRVYPNFVMPLLMDVDYSGSNWEYLTSTYGGLEDGKEYIWYQKYFNSSWDWFFDDDWIGDDDPWDPYNGDLWGDNDQDNTLNNVEPTRNLTRGTNEPSRGKPLGNWGHDFERSERVDRDMRFVPFIQVEERVKKGLSTNDYINEDKALVDNMKCTYNFLDYLYDDLTVSSELVSGKTPIGICVVASGLLPDGNARFMALRNLELDNPYPNPPEYGDVVVWSRTGYYVLTIAKSEAKATKDYNGKENTRLISGIDSDDWRDDGDNRIYPEEQNFSTWDSPFLKSNHEVWSMLMYYYNPGLTNKGDWYLPAAGEFLQLHNLDLVNEKISAVNGRELDLDVYWTSTEQGPSTVYKGFVTEVTSGNTTTYSVSVEVTNKNDDALIRPFIQIPSNRVEKLEKTKVDKEEGKGLSTIDYLQEDKELVNSLKSPEYHVYDLLFDDGSVGTELSDEKTPIGICISVNNNEALFFALKKLCINTCKGQTFGLAVTWDDATELAKEFSPGAYNGQWRLPTRLELLIQYNMNDELYDYLLEIMPDQRSNIWNTPSWAVWTSDKNGNNRPYYIDYGDGSAIASSSSYNDQYDAWAVISLLNKNPYATKEYVLDNINESPTARPFHSSWRTNTTLANFCSDIVSDSTTLIGNSYLGELRCTGLPTGMINGEVRVDVLGESNNNKILLLTVTSTNLSPYHWELTYFNGTQYGWRKWVLDDDYVHTDNNFTNANKNKLDKAEIPYEKLYLTFIILESGTLELRHWAASLSYSLNDGDTWTSITPNQSVLISLTAGDKLIWKGITDSNDLGGSYWEIDYDTNVVYDILGNIMSLLYGDNFIGLTSLVGTQQVDFKGSKIRSAKNLILPATTLTQSCYSGMFDSCTYLIDAPKLPATTLASGCYDGMFIDCINLTTAPELPAAILATYCYNEMFYGCRLLNYIKCLATVINSGDCSNWVNGVSETGTFVRAENMEKWTVGVDGIPSGWIDVGDKEINPSKKYELYNYQLNHNQYNYVDLGLPSGTLWAKTNVGANIETDYGNHYQYGKGAAVYATTESQADYSTHENPLALSADTARLSWGGDWHMPTKTLIQELVDNTTYSWETNFKGSGHNGAKFTASNGNYVFFPAAGCYLNMEGQEHEYGSEACIWSSTPKSSDEAWYLLASSSFAFTFDSESYYFYDSGFSVRPVIEPNYIPKYATVQEVSTKENITPIQTVSSGTTLTAVTEKLYKFTGAVSDLTVTLTAPTVTTKVSLYTFRFLTDSTVTNITFNAPANTRLLEPENLSWDADTEYEVSIMFDGVDYVLSCNKYIVPLINP